MAKSKKVNKWEAAPESIKLLHNAFTAFNTLSYDELDDKVDWDELDELLVDVLRSYNELEAKHNADCGLISKLEEENKDLESKLDSVTRERNRAVILDLRKEEEHSQALSKVITRKNTEMCNLKWQRDETEKKLRILTEELTRQYNINVTFYQRPGIDMHGLKNFGVHVDCEENRKAFNDLNEELNKYKAKNEKLEEKHAKATRFISRLTEALSDAGVEFHYVKFGGDGEEIFHIDSVVDKCAKRHYEEQYDRLRGTIRNYEAQIYEFKNDRREIDHRNRLLLKALDQVGICPSFDNRANKWRIQYTGKAENAFLAADQIKRDAEKKINKLVSALDKCRLDAKWDCENDKWCIYIRPSDTELTGVSFDLCEVVEGYEKLKNENKALILEKGHLKSKNRSWQIKCNNLQRLLDFKLREGTPCGITNCPRVEELAAVNEGLNDHVEALKKKLNTIYGYRDTDNPCGICKNFDPKE